MKVEQIMTRDVASVSPETTLKEVAELLVRRRIAGVPVIDVAGRVVGVVSEGDLLWKELGLPSSAGFFDRILESAYGEEQRTGARTAGESMSAPAVTTSPDATAAEAARLMVENHVNRLPVLERGQLIGIVARSDLVRAFRRSDEEIEHEISDDVLLHTLWVDPDAVSLVILDGEVTVAGEIENRTTAELIVGYIRRVPGVVGVQSRLTWKVDDLARRTGAAADRIQARV
jgi:CBS domain-containing protein